MNLLRLTTRGKVVYPNGERVQHGDLVLFGHASATCVGLITNCFESEAAKLYAARTHRALHNGAISQLPFKVVAIRHEPKTRIWKKYVKKALDIHTRNGVRDPAVRGFELTKTIRTPGDGTTRELILRPFTNYWFRRVPQEPPHPPFDLCPLEEFCPVKPVVLGVNAMVRNYGLKKIERLSDLGWTILGSIIFSNIPPFNHLTFETYEDFAERVEQLKRENQGDSALYASTFTGRRNGRIALGYDRLLYDLQPQVLTQAATEMDAAFARLSEAMRNFDPLTPDLLAGLHNNIFVS